MSHSRIYSVLGTEPSDLGLALLLLARLIGQYCFVRWCYLSALSVVVCNAAGGQAAWAVGRRRARHVGGPAANTARWARTVTCHYGDTLLFNPIAAFELSWHEIPSSETSELNCASDKLIVFDPPRRSIGASDRSIASNGKQCICVCIYSQVDG